MNDFNFSDVGKQIKKLRENEKLTQSEFAKKVSLTQAAISQFEDGKRVPSTKALRKIALGMGVPLEVFFGVLSAESDPEKKMIINQLVSKLECLDKLQVLALNRYVGDLSSPEKEDV